MQKVVKFRLKYFDIKIHFINNTLISICGLWCFLDLLVNVVNSKILNAKENHRTYQLVANFSRAQNVCININYKY